MSHTMLYKSPGEHKFDGGTFDYAIVADEAVPEALAAGWHLTTTDAKAYAEGKLPPKVTNVDDLTGDAPKPQGKKK